MNTNRVRCELSHGEQVARIVLATPKANILDRATMLEFIDTLRGLARREGLKALIVDSDGPHFSFGASVEEHLPGQIEETLALLRRLLEEVALVSAPTIAAVRGQCLGGGLELALACDFIVAEEGAQLGLPEIKLGVFPPAGAALLPIRIGASRSAGLIITGESWSAASALSAGLVHKVASVGQLNACIEDWLQPAFLPRSATALRYAALAARKPVIRAIKTDLPELERMYLDELMLQPDAVEGIQAFLDRRQPSSAAGRR
jgi:cyclohexa-1,5-dienecarbonyl-CoA hydratase